MKDYHFSATLPQDARDIIEKILKEYLSLKTETISIYKAHGKFVAKDYLSLNTSPPIDVAAMDGYAINAEQTFNTTDANPAIIENFKVVQTGESIEGFDAVVPFEEAQIEDGKIKIFQSYYPRQNVRSKGEDVQKDQFLVKKGDFLTFFDKVYLKAGGYLEIEVYKMPKVAFLPTGEELVDIVEKEGQLVEFNSVIFNDLLQRYGFEVGIFKPVENNLKKLTEKIKELLQEFDIVFVNAGSSKGDQDLTAEAISALGEVLVHGIAIKPGKPTIIGKIENKLVIGLPGFPVSMFFVLREIFLRSFFKAYNLNPKEKSIFATLERRLSSDIGSEEYVRVSIENIDGKNVAKVLRRGASVISSLKRADGYVTVPINVDLIEEGSLLEVKLI
ncbi:molybdopterin molybdotransferase MoeA [Caldicellulosiruptor naganoensis]|uniref:Molybdopterin molybdenumtransferase n=1 Tax=Caldicellulosiruptor naganoensis TaxID=29324 RepID=A0ABY7BIA3_9FIRM|nr:molybdopterin molybdotransferase MoeA [Caldicellulosiruptor naganoensis]WAM32225.1 molybdopterin molybdotransferase MoeA [Caldicellulosiruptor naganoensis]